MTVVGTAAPAGAKSALVRSLPLVGLGLAVVVLALLTGGRRTDGEPLDPRSTAPLGARALVLLLERFGARVEVAGDVAPRDTTAVLLVDRLGEAARTRLRQWVETGGTLIVADPMSDLAPALAPGDAGLFGDEEAGDGDLLRPRCPLPALAEVGRIEVPGAVPLRVGPGATGCFPVDDGAYLVARPMGGGVVVALGGGGPFVNRQLDDADNAVLAVSLMAPRGDERVVVLEPSAPGSGREGLSDLVSRRVKDALWQLLVAFGLFALWRARRLGRPVLEPQPVQLAGSELVGAVGNLLQQARRRDQAATMLRAQLRRSLSELLGLPVDAPPAVMAEAAAQRAGVPPGQVADALAPTPVPDDASLVRLAQLVESLRKEVSHAR
ncbi:MAG: hypothetical protein KY454_01965 [Actinobacteria bacterium]|nr:hypothetical protein [Actinomycetota bacterium]MBW3649884.1 hypothetical protein [Actinomycetota bacterium]